jgi:hypothetical protein
MQHAAAVATLFVATVVLAGCSGSTGPSLPAPMVDRVAGTTTAEAPDPEREREPVVPASATADGSQVPTVTTPTATPTPPSTGAQTSNETVTESSTARSQPPVGDGVQSVSRLTSPLTAEACLVERRQS